MSDAGLRTEEIKGIVDLVLAEDIGDGDVTTRVTIPKNSVIKASIVARQKLVVSGIPIIKEIFGRLAPKAKFLVQKTDGSEALRGQAIIYVEGFAQGILTAERSALNVLQFLSGIATLTKEYIEQLKGTNVRLLDTRKTIPGLRVLSKYAVRCGGGENHRMRLDDGILIKDNHIASAGGVSSAIKMAKAKNTSRVPIQVECDTLDQVAQALKAEAHRILLDNMSLEDLRQAVSVVSGQIPLEASGGITTHTIREVAETGVDYISVGAITQKAPAVDIGLDIT